MDNDQVYYTSKDFYLSACLLAAGLKLSHLSKSAEGFFIFHFYCSENEGANFLKQHWTGELTPSTKKVVEAIYELKSRMRLESKG